MCIETGYITTFYIYFFLFCYELLHCASIFQPLPRHPFGPGSLIGIATGYELDVLRFESRWGPDFPNLFRAGRPSLLYNGYRVFPGSKVRPGRDADPSPPSSATVMKEQSYTSTPPSGPYGLQRASVPVQGCTLIYICHDSRNVTYHCNEIIYFFVITDVW